MTGSKKQSARAVSTDGMAVKLPTGEAGLIDGEVYGKGGRLFVLVRLASGERRECPWPVKLSTPIEVMGQLPESRTKRPRRKKKE